MVSALDSGSSGLGSSPGWGHYVVFLGNTLTVPLSTQVYTAVKGCPTKAYERTRQCRKVLWVMMASCGLIKAKGVSA